MILRNKCMKKSWMGKMLKELQACGRHCWQEAYSCRPLCSLHFKNLFKKQKFQDRSIVIFLQRSGCQSLRGSAPRQFPPMWTDPYWGKPPAWLVSLASRTPLYNLWHPCLIPLPHRSAVLLQIMSVLYCLAPTVCVLYPCKVKKKDYEKISKCVRLSPPD